MNAGEVFWRTTQIAQRGLDKEPDHGRAVDWQAALADFRNASGRPILLDRETAVSIAKREPAMVSKLIKAASAVRDLEFSFFGYPPARLNTPIDWHFDPIARVRWPILPSHRMDHRFAEGDVKWVWELNRLQHLPWLAEAWLFTGDRSFSAAAFEQIDTWIEQNPRGRGIAWRGAFEAGLRAISLAVALQGLRDSADLTVERYRRAVGVLAHSAYRCWKERSRFSSANNHLIGEMTGLAVVALLFPELPLARQWEKRSIHALSVEASKQILPDGSGAEQSASYQMATVEFLQLVCVLLRRRGTAVPPPITKAIVRSTDFLSAVVGTNDPDPRWGDDDLGFAVRLGPEAKRTVRDHIGIVATSCDGAVNTSGNRTLTAEWYRSAVHTQPVPTGPTTATPPTQPRSLYAPVGGIVVMRSGHHRLTMDVGPLGYLSIAAHGHADALAVTLSEDREDVIGDPGTGSYYGDPELRTVMRGTRAHPTVCIDNHNQSDIAGPFLWSRHARAHVHRVDLLAGIVDAEHDGYTHLPGQPVHRRWLIAPPDDRVILIADLISGGGIHHARATWPVAPAVEVTRISGGYRLTRTGSLGLQLLQTATAPMANHDVYGDEVQKAGWWSAYLEHRVPTWWLSGICEAELPLAFVSLLTPIDGVDTSSLEVTLGHDSLEITWREDARPRVIAIDTASPARVDLRSN